jgi:hypothetical protein
MLGGRRPMCAHIVVQKGQIWLAKQADDFDHRRASTADSRNGLQAAADRLVLRRATVPVNLRLLVIDQTGSLRLAAGWVTVRNSSGIA